MRRFTGDGWVRQWLLSFPSQISPLTLLIAILYPPPVESDVVTGYASLDDSPTPPSVLWSQCTSWTVPQAITRWRLVVTCDSVWRRLAWTCDGLRRVASTFSSNFHASGRKFLTVWPTNPSPRKLVSVLFPLVEHECAYKAALKWCTCESFWLLMASLCSQVHIS